MNTLWILLIVFPYRSLAEDTCRPNNELQSSNPKYNQCKLKWTNLLQMLMHGSQDEFKMAIWPFANATKNTYTWRLEEPVNGWTLIRERNPISGMHALAYQVNFTNGRLFSFSKSWRRYPQSSSKS